MMKILEFVSCIIRFICDYFYNFNESKLAIYIIYIMYKRCKK